MAWPSILEKHFLLSRQVAVDNPDLKQLALLTNVRELSFVVGSRYARVNIFLLEESKETTKVEIRYINITSAGKNFFDYKNDTQVGRIFKRIEELVK